ncbi:hypothetical protein PITC_017450 [Penicillium italicum]|uniref:Uncharacterized protein n=1 Tax=Penicillium italicum TaxID=40296 RepID=A0A0A2KMQ3_PENIT|nr:hypothetical protein PITC_017450 [Penicillium italicum]
MITIRSLLNTYLKEINTRTFSGQLSLQFSLVGLLALVLTIYVLAEPLYTPSLLAAIFSRLILSNLFSYTLYALYPLKRIRIA